MIALLLGGGAAALSTRNESDTSGTFDEAPGVNAFEAPRSIKPQGKRTADETLLLNLEAAQPPRSAPRAGGAASSSSPSMHSDHSRVAVIASASTNSQLFPESRPDPLLRVDAPENEQATIQLVAPVGEHREEQPAELAEPAIPPLSLSRALDATPEIGILERPPETTVSLANPAVAAPSELRGTEAANEADIRGTASTGRLYSTATLADGVIELVAVDTTPEEIPLAPPSQADSIGAMVVSVPEIEPDEIARQHIAPPSSPEQSPAINRTGEANIGQTSSSRDDFRREDQAAPLASVRPLEAAPSSNATVSSAALDTRTVYLTGEIATRINGENRGSLVVRIAPDDQLSVRLSDLLSLFRDAMDKASFDRFIASSSANEYVSLGKLREAGFTLDFDALTEQLILGLE